LVFDMVISTSVFSVPSVVKNKDSKWNGYILG